MANSLCSLSLVALSLLILPIGSFALRSRSPDTGHLAESLVQEAANTTETDSGHAISGLANVDIADVQRYGFINWHIVRDGRAVQENFDGKYVSAKPRGIVWDRIGKWNYDKSSTKTNDVIKINLAGSTGALVKLNLALRFQYGGRVKTGWLAHPELANKGRFLRKIRVVPYTYVSDVHGGYSLNARVSEVSVRRIGTRSDPIAEAKLKIIIQYGRKRARIQKWHKKVWEITVQGTGRYFARELSSTVR